MKQGQIPTLKQIAKRLKLSTSTVSRALKDHPSIGLVTTMRVKKLAAELNYEPDNRAIFFKQQKTFTIGVVLPNLSEAFFSTAISAIEDMATAHNYTVILGQSLDDEARELKILESFKKHRVDGIIVSLSKNTNNFDFIETFQKMNIPVVFFDCVPDREDVYRIVSDLETGMIEAINTFVSCGHNRIALINGPESLLASKQREEGFIKGLKSNDINVNRDYIFHTNLSEKGNQEAVEELLSLVDRPSAVICFSDYVTLDAMKLVREKGLVINQDIFFISFANFPIWNHIENKPMASIEQFPGKQAEKAAEILFDLIKEDETNKGNHIIYPSRLIHLDSSKQTSL
ncbi:LacI family DNA-binding transcriptional regulator [Albibacterium bauzanense]|uniref:LacI family transcriptional regulator n=1 Tax=Albibacterium bauzanense TaxID=653929 RepID=A0A4R1M0W2_9SPHI|nr:LacI family DNA-binding transcriptional regulator [Albibacterium bauzanense]TCK84852.1 LacI family transcriptional regulator [Albibacterium bauzanense]